MLGNIGKLIAKQAAKRMAAQAPAPAMVGRSLGAIAPAVEKQAPAAPAKKNVINKIQNAAAKVQDAFSKPMVMPKGGNLGDMLVRKGRTAPSGPPPSPTEAAHAAQMNQAFKKGGSVGSASKRADGIASKGKTKGTMVAMKNGKKYC